VVAGVKGVAVAEHWGEPVRRLIRKQIEGEEF
jgi:hypothetical protein